MGHELSLPVTQLCPGAGNSSFEGFSVQVANGGEPPNPSGGSKFPFTVLRIVVTDAGRSYYYCS